MPPAAHLFSQNVPGYRQPDGRCTFNVSPCSSRNDYIRFPQAMVLPLGCASRGSMSSICNANSSGQRRNPDFSRQNRHGFSRNKIRHNEGQDSTENLEDSEIFYSKNGPPLLSNSASPKFQATATPGPREREIVELFRKVQAKLRERAALKEEKKVEDSQGPNKQNETVDSLLKLLRKHSGQHGKRSSNSSSNKDFILDQPEQNSSFLEDKNPTFFDPIEKVKHEGKDSKVPSVSRPVSNFQRRSPVPQFKYQPVLSDEETFDFGEFTKIESKKKEIKSTPEPKVESDDFSSNGRVFNENSDDETSEIDDSEEEDVSETSDIDDLSGMKLPELRAVAKARGLKGFSRLKKLELLELLTNGGSV